MKSRAPHGPNFDQTQKSFSGWRKTRQDTFVSIAQWLYNRRVKRESTGGPPNPIKIVCISDTHSNQPTIPDGDALLHAGDLSRQGSFEGIQAQLDWLKTLPHRYKVVIAGNHDLILDPEYVSRFPERIVEQPGSSRDDLDWGDIIYLNDTSATLQFDDGRSLRVYGSPWTKQFGTWAFQYPPIRDIWTDVIPLDTDILLTHGPPRGYLDLGGLGSEFLLKEIWRAKPRLVVFGHIHDGHGRRDVLYDGIQAVYDGVVHGEQGFSAVVMLFVQFACQWLRWLLFPGPQKPGAKEGTFINAAVVRGLEEQIGQPATTFDFP